MFMLKYPWRSSVLVKTYWLKGYVMDRAARRFTDKLLSGAGVVRAVRAMVDEIGMNGYVDYRKDAVYDDNGGYFVDCLRMRRKWYPDDLPGVMVDLGLRLVVLNHYEFLPYGAWLDQLLWSKGRWVRVSIADYRKLSIRWPTVLKAAWCRGGKTHVLVREWFRGEEHIVEDADDCYPRNSLPMVVLE